MIANTWTVQTVAPADTSAEAEHLAHDDEGLIELPGLTIRLGRRGGVPAVHIEMPDLCLVAQADVALCEFSGGLAARWRDHPAAA